MISYSGTPRNIFSKLWNDTDILSDYGYLSIAVLSTRENNINGAGLI